MSGRVIVIVSVGVSERLGNQWSKRSKEDSEYGIESDVGLDRGEHEWKEGL